MVIGFPPPDHRIDAKKRGIVHRRLPNQGPVNAKVLVNQNIAKTYDVLPRHGTISSLNFRTQAADGLPNRGEPLRDCIAQGLVGQKAWFNPAAIAFAIQSSASTMSVSRWSSRRIDQACVGKHANPYQRL